MLSRDRGHAMRPGRLGVHAIRAREDVSAKIAPESKHPRHSVGADRVSAKYEGLAAEFEPSVLTRAPPPVNRPRPAISFPSAARVALGFEGCSYRRGTVSARFDLLKVWAHRRRDKSVATSGPARPRSVGTKNRVAWIFRRRRRPAPASALTRLPLSFPRPRIHALPIPEPTPTTSRVLASEANRTQESSDMRCPVSGSHEAIARRWRCWRPACASAAAGSFTGRVCADWARMKNPTPARIISAPIAAGFRKF